MRDRENRKEKNNADDKLWEKRGVKQRVQGCKEITGNGINASCIRQK